MLYPHSQRVPLDKLLFAKDTHSAIGCCRKQGAKLLGISTEMRLKTECRLRDFQHSRVGSTCNDTSRSADLLPLSSVTLTFAYSIPNLKIERQSWIGTPSPDNLFLKRDSSTLRKSSNPVCGFSMREQVRLCAVWPTENWLGSSMNHIQGWMTV